jgi:hypothetical protein
MSYICLDLALRERVGVCTGSSGFKETHRLIDMSIMFPIKTGFRRKHEEIV